MVLRKPVSFMLFILFCGVFAMCIRSYLPNSLTIDTTRSSNLEYLKTVRTFFQCSIIKILQSYFSVYVFTIVVIVKIVIFIILIFIISISNT